MSAASRRRRSKPKKRKSAAQEPRVSPEAASPEPTRPGAAATRPSDAGARPSERAAQPSEGAARRSEAGPREATRDGFPASDPLRGWRITGLVALAVIVLSIPLYAVIETRRMADATLAAAPAPTFVGRDGCVDCHRAAYESWTGSDHDNAMAHATEETVLGDFDDAEFAHGGVTTRFFRRDGGYFIHTEGPGGEMGDFEVQYTFGVEPLQQYLVPFAGGRLQAFSLAWHTEEERWFFLYGEQDIPADDWLHWTRNGQNWNGMCAECHSTNLIKGFDPETRTYETTFSEIDVSCEACHGPGSRHVAWAEIPPMARRDVDNYELLVRTGDIDNRQQVALCAPCHSRHSELDDYDHTQTDLLDVMLPALLREGLYHVDGQILDEDYVWGSFVQSKMYANGIRCSDCHDVHSLQFHESGNALCTQCHRADTYDAYEHHFHQKVYEGEQSDGALCIKCHMPEQPFMVVDYRADHSLRVPRPDLTAELGVPNACTQSGCHDDRPLQWSIDAFTTWYGRARKPHFGTILAAAREGAPEAHGQLIELIENTLYPAIVRATALEALRAYPSDETTRVIRRALADEDALVRHTAVDSTVVADPAELVSLLAPLLFDPVKAVRLRAASELASVSAGLFQPYQRDALQEALDEYVSATERSLDFAAGGMNLGNLAMARNEPQQAERYYRTALEIDELFFPAKMNLAVLLSQQGRDAESEQLLREILEAYPDQSDAAYSLALLLAGSGRAVEAEPLLRQAAEGMPGNARVRYNHGLLLQQLGDDAGAEAQLSEALALDPGQFDYLYALYDFYLKRERLQEALAMADRIIAAHPGNPAGPQLKAAVQEQIRSR